jgi:transposase
MERILTLSKREQKRLMVLNEVEKGKLKVWQAAEVMGVCERQGWRILAAYREGGAAGLAHGNRGRKPVHTLSEEVRDEVIMLAQKKYVGFNHQHMTEEFAEREGLEISRSACSGLVSASGLLLPNRGLASRKTAKDLGFRTQAGKNMDKT